MNAIALQATTVSPATLVATISSDPEVKEAIIWARCQAEVDARNDLAGGYRTRNHRGIRAYQQFVQYLGQKLEPLGFKFSLEDDQARYTTVSRYETEICLVPQRAKDHTTYFEYHSPRERRATRRILSVNKQRHDPQLKMAFVEDEPINDKPHYVFIMTQLIKTRLTIWVTVPYDLSSDGLRLRHYARQELFSDDFAIVNKPTIKADEPVVIEPILVEREA